MRLLRLTIPVFIFTSSLFACNKNSAQDKETLGQLTTTSNIIEFTSKRNFIQNGESVTLHWLTKGATRIFLGSYVEGQLKEVQIDPINTESMEVKPLATSEFRLRIEDANGRSNTASLTIDVQAISFTKKSYPIAFVTQVPTLHDKNTRLSAFANHRTSPLDVPRGGDLMLRYPNGHLRNLTQEAGLGNDGKQGAKAIAVREPSVDFSGTKILVSLLLGAPQPNEDLTRGRWQIYEFSGLAQGQKVQYKKIENQDSRYNNLSPIYSNNDEIIFTSDRPRNGAEHLYPQLDEYEATPSITGIWKLNPKIGQLQLLSHTPSGAFNPLIDAFGRVIFTRWDHLQQDQLADRDRDAVNNKVILPFKSFNFSDESATARKLSSRQEFFPESRVGSNSIYGEVSAFRNNFFTIWQINQDGSGEETLNHIGQHELSFGYLTPSFLKDTNLNDRTDENRHSNRYAVRREGGLFHLREDPLDAGTFYAINARESGSFTTDTIIKIDGKPHRNPEQMRVIPITKPDASDRLEGGRFRNPLPLSDGRLIASHTTQQLPPAEENSLENLRLKWLERDEKTAHYRATEALTKGLKKNITWWNGSNWVKFNDNLWELDAVELRPRTQSTRATTQLEAPERAIFQEENINEMQLRQWLTQQKLALIITRDQTSRDQADLQQPFNLAVANGVKTVSKIRPNGKLYTISHFQILQAEQIRAYPDRPGRRNLAQIIKDFPNDQTKLNQIPSSVIIAKDGSTAAFVPAERALTWQTTDGKGNPVVRERNWVTFKAGEIRTCAACHGVNSLNQANFPAPMNKPEALRELLNNWKASIK